MMYTIALCSGITHIHTLDAILALMWSTQCFGYLTEELSRPGRYEQVDGLNSCDATTPRALQRADFPWTRASLQGQKADAWLLQDRWVRLRPHVLGYGPYLAAWSIQIHSFYWNYLHPEQERKAPSFVHAIVWGQFAVFSLFGITQLWNQWDSEGPSWYWKGELSYLVLSLVAKGFLGLLLIVNVLVFSSFDEAVADALVNES